MLIKDVVPAGYEAVAALERYVRSAVDPSILNLVKVRASIRNGCAYCVDLHTREAGGTGSGGTGSGGTRAARRLFALAAWREAPWFDDRERAALALTDAVTQLGESGVPDEVWDEAVTHFGMEQVANLVLAIGTINLWNRIAVTTRMQPPGAG